MAHLWIRESVSDWSILSLAEEAYALGQACVHYADIAASATWPLIELCGLRDADAAWLVCELCALPCAFFRSDRAAAAWAAGAPFPTNVAVCEEGGRVAASQ